jgi:ribosomal-protein-serine acetyltransferase
MAHRDISALDGSYCASMMCRFELSEGRLLRFLEEEDAAELYDVIDANRDYLARWMPWAAEQTLEDTVAFIWRTRKQLTDNDGFQTAIVEHERIVGMIGFHGLCWQQRSTKIGYWLAEPAQGRGVMSCAVRKLLDHAFGAWRLDRVEIHVGVQNARSRAVAQRVGFKYEGVLHEAERVGDRFIDRALYAILAGDWHRR